MNEQQQKYLDELNEAILLYKEKTHSASHPMLASMIKAAQAYAKLYPILCEFLDVGDRAENEVWGLDDGFVVDGWGNILGSLDDSLGFEKNNRFIVTAANMRGKIREVLGE